MGMIGTRSLTTVIPGINELEEHAKTRIRDGIKAYDALMQIRAPVRPTRLRSRSPELLRGPRPRTRLRPSPEALCRRSAQATDAQIDQAARDTIPHVPTLFWSFRIMVGLGMFFILLTATFFWLSARRISTPIPGCCVIAVLAIPLPFIAIEFGWVVAEFGRQPWIIEGVLPTAAAVSSLGASTVLLTIIGFAALYTVLIVIEMSLMVKAIRKGPEPDNEPEAELISETLVHAAE
jgi:cytochrome d ubiquinol oxidase subunit I